jgi:hypothetical protein
VVVSAPDITIGDLTIFMAGEELVLQQPSKVTHHIDELELDREQQVAVFLYVSRVLREAKPVDRDGAEAFAAMQGFHSHLDVCEQCEGRPFNLCQVGAQLIQEAAGKVLSSEAVPQ